MEFPELLQFLNVNLLFKYVIRIVNLYYIRLTYIYLI